MLQLVKSSMNSLRKKIAFEETKKVSIGVMNLMRSVKELNGKTFEIRGVKIIKKVPIKLKNETPIL